MNTENAIKTAVGFFLIILLGALLAALVGGAFGALVAIISPEFVRELFSRSAEAALTRYAFAVGMIWGVFIGAAVTSFACLLAAVVKIFRVRFEILKERRDQNLEGVR